MRLVIANAWKQHLRQRLDGRPREGWFQVAFTVRTFPGHRPVGAR